MTDRLRNDALHDKVRTEEGDPLPSTIKREAEVLRQQEGPGAALDNALTVRTVKRIVREYKRGRKTAMDAMLLIQALVDEGDL